MDLSTSYEPSAATLREYMPIVHRIVAQLGRRLPRSVPREDLLAAGTIGLYQALKKGPPTTTAMFAAYAAIRVRGAIFDELRRLDWFPRRRRPSTDIVVDGGPVQNISDAVKPPANAPASASASASRERAIVRIDDLEVTSPLSASDGTPSDHVEQKHTFLALQGAVESLPTRERAVVRMRYFDGMTGKAVASALGLSEARVSQLHARAIDRLRRTVEGDEPILLAA
jgi:RNA polymerase sigma factor for flagellar operon FliA